MNAPPFSIYERRPLAGPARFRAAFTLIELIVSTALLSMILGGAYYCLRAGLSTQRLVDAREEMLQNGRVAIALISADLRAAGPLSKDAEFIGMQRTVGAVRADNLDFATANYTPRRPGEADWCEVSYFLDKDPKTGQFSLWRRRDSTRDAEPFSGGTRQEIAAGVRGLRFEYYDGFDWYEEWGDPEQRAVGQLSWKDRSNLSGLPEAVRVTLWFEPNPRTRESSNTSAEPPLILQTIARLNFAPVSLSSAISGASPSTSSPAREPVGPSPGGDR